MADTKFPVNESLTNYSYADIATGTGYQTYYAGACYHTAAAIVYALSDIIFYSNPIASSNAASLDIDFDFLVNRPLNISGNAIINIPISINYSNPDPSGTWTITPTAKIRKWDGTTETDIASQEGYTHTGVYYDAGTSYGYATIKLVVPLTHFKRGDYIRLTILVTGTAPTKQSVSLAHDPMARTTGWDTSGTNPSKLSIQLPFKIPV